jgi:type II secretion system protein N
MMERRRLTRIIALTAAGLFLLPALTYLFFPIGRVNTVISRQLESQGLTMTPTARKTLIPGLAWNDLLLSSAQGPLIACDLLKVRLMLTPLLAGRVKLKASAAIQNGRLDLEYGLTGKELLRLGGDGINLADMPFFKTVLAAKAAGTLWVEGAVVAGPKGPNGEVKLEVRQLEFSGVKLGGFSLPDASNLRTRGMVRVTDGNFRLESFTLQGEGIYMRISGDIPGGANAVNAPLNLVLEIMPNPEFLEKQKLVFMLLAKFMVSPGNYRLPIQGTLLKPVIL